jgi:predicted  nucleic acid-binding Zn-ribbon protein
MTDPADNLILEILKRIQSDIHDMKEDIGDVKLRLTATEEHLSTLIMSTSGINHRLDRMDTRIERIEKRLDLTEPR